MSKRLRESLGLVAVGLALLVISLMGLGYEDGSDGEAFFAIPRLVGGFLLIAGLIMAAVELLRPNHTKSSSGE